jgi:NADPH:quinone reductase-like Zn-dependent oxidoreductase
MPDVLQLDDLPIPVPTEGEIRLRVKAIGLNRAESLFRQNRHPAFTPKLPSKIGYEASGIVDAVGPGVDRSWLGKTASTVPAFPTDAYGVYGEVAIVPVRAVAEYPANLSYEEGASIWMRYITAYGALIREGKLTRGDFVIITAASSNVGIAAIEIAKIQGAISIATTRTATKRAELLAQGADHVIVTDEEDLPERVNAITGGKGARIIFDPIGGKGLCSLAEAAGHSGTIFEYGILADDSTPYPLFTALSKHLTIKAYSLFEVVANPVEFPQEFLRAKKYVFDNLANGNFRPIIGRTFPLADIVEAHRYMESASQIGKIVIRV